MLHYIYLLKILFYLHIAVSTNDKLSPVRIIEKDLEAKASRSFIAEAEEARMVPQYQDY